MTRRRRATAAVLLAAIGSAAVVALLVTPAQAQAPDVAAWWNAANAGNGAPPPPPPPDVAAGDLLVQGSNAAPAAPVSGAPASSQAVAGLSFDLPDGASVGALTLEIDGSAPPTTPTIVACKATQRFAAVDNGAWTDVPPSDCSQTSSAKLSGAKLVFDDISKLVDGSRLSITILPGSLDRVVLKKPGDNALAVTSAGGLGAAAPPLGSGASGGFGTAPGGAAPGQPVAPVGGAAVLPPAGSGSSAVAPPVVAPPSPSVGRPGTQPVAAASAAGVGGLSTTARRVLAGVVIALELVGFLLLMGDRGVERLAAAPVAATVAGGRMRAPDRGPRAPGGATTVGGVGRFRVERQGSPPRL